MLAYFYEYSYIIPTPQIRRINSLHFPKSLYCMTGYISAFTFNVAIDYFDCIISKENAVPHIYVVRKGRNVLIPFKNNCGYSFWILHQNLTTGSFLKAHCLVESETISVGFSLAVILKSIGVFCTLNGSSTPAYDIVTSGIGHLENMGSLSYAGLLTC